MPNPTSTALNVNDNFSGSNLNPQYGDVARQGQVTLKSVNAAQSTENGSQNPVYEDEIYVNFDDHNDTKPKYVKKTGTVYLVSKSNTNVCTYNCNSNGLAPVFDPGPPPYLAIPYPGKGYNFASNIAIGSCITLVVTTTGDCASDCRDATGDNPTINVGV